MSRFLKAMGVERRGVAASCLPLVLVGQYESWTVPLPVILCAAVSLLGGLIGIRAAGLAMNIYCQLGLLMLAAATVGLLFVPPLYVLVRPRR